LGRNGNRKEYRNDGNERVKKVIKKRDTPKGDFLSIFSPFPILMPWLLPLTSPFIPKTL
jgi:hypothetical protein